jgi:hypothetical protein
MSEPAPRKPAPRKPAPGEPAGRVELDAAIAAADSALGSTIPDANALDGIWPTPVAPDGLVQLAKAQWPGTRGDDLPPVAGFVTSAFSPLVAAVADLCLLDYFGEPPAARAHGERTAIVLVSSTGDLPTSAAIADAVQAGKRVPPLLFYQSNHNAVAGYIAARWGLFGPVVCTMPGSAVGAGHPDTALSRELAEAVASAALLIEDGDADAALVIAANAYLDGRVDGTAMLVGPASWPLAATLPAAAAVAAGQAVTLTPSPGAATPGPTDSRTLTTSAN